MRRVSSEGNEGRYTKIGAIGTVVGVIVAVIAILVSVNIGGDGKVKTTQTDTPKPAQASQSSAVTASADAPPVASSPPLVTYIEDLEVTPDSDPYDNRD